MGGYGSGSRSNSKLTVDSQTTLDIRYLKKRGILKNGGSGSLFWASSRDKNTLLCSIDYRMEELGIRLLYKIPANDEAEPVSVDSLVLFDYTPCHYGGQRTWFICPNPRCQRRVISLHHRWGYFLCRHCCDLNYQSQHESYFNRSLSKSHALCERLGVKAGESLAFSDKPKGMHWKTYNKLRQQAEESRGIFFQHHAKNLGFDGYQKS